MAKVKEKVFRTASGETLTEEDIEKIADEVESDDPVVFTAVRPVGRPSLDGNGTSPRLSFRVPQELYDAAARRAIAEERTVSAVAREALERYVAE
jgi:predicted HicB family RNase H-like nuclease